MWYYNDKEFTSSDIGDHIGFVYIITETTTGRKYIGKKIFYNKVSKPPLKGKTRRRISKKESDWKTYYGSNDELQKLVALNGEVGYKRTILHLCRSKSEMSYLELKEQVVRDALISEEYINGWIKVRITRGQLRNLQDN